MTQHQIEIIKFFLKPIWLPLLAIFKGFKRAFSNFKRDLIGDDASDAWGAFAGIGVIGGVCWLLFWPLIGFKPIIIFSIVMTLERFTT